MKFHPAVTMGIIVLGSLAGWVLLYAAGQNLTNIFIAAATGG